MPDITGRERSPKAKGFFCDDPVVMAVFLNALVNAQANKKTKMKGEDEGEGLLAPISACLLAGLQNSGSRSACVEVLLVRRFVLVVGKMYLQSIHFPCAVSLFILRCLFQAVLSSYVFG